MVCMVCCCGLCGSYLWNIGLKYSDDVRVAGELLDDCADSVAQVSEECNFVSAGLADVGAADGVDARLPCG